MNFIYEFLRNIITTMLQLIWSSKGKITNSLSIYVKTNTGNTLTVNLDPKWDIKNVKEIVAPQMGISPEDVKIIFAGKELHNSTIIEECDLGQQSILHAVKMPKKKLKKPKITIDELSEVSELNESGSKPMNETLSDLSFDDSNNTIDDDKKRAHFYIYCSKPCKNVEAGKLRVKCSLCSSGAVTVDRDPQSWQDVLKKNRITVHCENDYCQSAQSNTQDDIQLSYAKFFFKCSNHPSLGENDEAVPLYLIKPNFKNIPCLACTDIKDTVLVFSCESSHVTCIDCFKEYCCVKLSERQFEFDDKSGYYTLPCPAGCDNSYINEVHHFRLLDNRQYEQYQRFGAEEYVLRAGGLLCPQPDCGMGIIPSNSDDVDDDNCRKIQCIGGCGYVFCKKCLNGFHLGDCDSQQPVASSSQSKFGGYSVDPNRAKDATWSEATKRTIQKSTKPCPKCRTPTERDGGCMHMFCTRAGCNFQWCWVCQTSWSRDCMGNHWFG
ncbi:E3 ubiquitin-protein ligase parkin [Aphidius gifuensis]|uniref:E3 ubiquitin-protein ligase parkin n=1 Tax=Aphidius gifuensis TaxID=684658 RepID=UPI001CDBC265|nr:E3 ubiquitin-protein ligase parkin [Aphidius gifuensis]